MWPFNRKPDLETRATGDKPFSDAFSNAFAKRASYTDGLISAIQSQATVGSDASQTAAVEIASGFLGRALSSAKVINTNLATSVLTPAVLNAIGRDLIGRGESVWKIDLFNGDISIIPVASWDITGGYRREDWYYRIDLFGPDQNTTEYAQSADIIHLQWSFDPQTPWLGIGPIQRSKITADGMTGAEAALRDEAKGPRGSLIPIADQLVKVREGEADPTIELRHLIANLNGKAALVETQQTGAGAGQAAAPQREWTPNRLGFNAPKSLGDLASEGARSVLVACGIPIELLSKAEGTASREALRRFLHFTVNPISQILQNEFRLKFNEPDLILNFDSLFASDLSGRARAFQSMIGGGMDMNKAAALAGLMAMDD